VKRIERRQIAGDDGICVGLERVGVGGRGSLKVLRSYI
jgi:hypothetical protein